jgi:hypothetical protein
VFAKRQSPSLDLCSTPFFTRMTQESKGIRPWNSDVQTQLLKTGLPRGVVAIILEYADGLDELIYRLVMALNQVPEGELQLDSLSFFNDTVPEVMGETLAEENIACIEAVHMTTGKALSLITENDAIEPDFDERKDKLPENLFETIVPDTKVLFADISDVDRGVDDWDLLARCLQARFPNLRGLSVSQNFSYKRGEQAVDVLKDLQLALRRLNLQVLILLDGQTNEWCVKTSEFEKEVLQYMAEDSWTILFQYHGQGRGCFGHHVAGAGKKKGFLFHLDSGACIGEIEDE